MAGNIVRQDWLLALLARTRTGSRQRHSCCFPPPSWVVEARWLSHTADHHAVPAPAVICSCGEFHPLMYLEGLAEAVVKHGGKIYEGTKYVHTGGQRMLRDSAWQHVGYRQL